MKMMTVAQWLEVHPGYSVSVRVNDTVAQVLRQVNNHSEVQDFYVCDGQGQVVGHISKTRLANVVLAPYRVHHSHRQLMERVAFGSADEFMVRDFPTAHPEEELDTVIHRMLEHRLQDMAVVDRHRHLLGTISLTILLQHLPESDLLY